MITCGLDGLRREAERHGVTLLVVPPGRDAEPALLDAADWVAVPRGREARVSAVTLAGRLALSLAALAA